MRTDYCLAWAWLLSFGINIMDRNWIPVLMAVAGMFWTARKVRRELDREFAQALRD